MPHFPIAYRTFLPCLLLAGLAACGPAEQPAVDAPDAALLRFNLDKSNPERLLRYYFGGYVGEAGGDPFAAGLLVEQEGTFYIHLDSLEARFPGANAGLQDANGSNSLEWEELEAFVDGTYYEARALPPTLAAFQQAVPYQGADTSWFHVEVDGVMTTARRHIYVATDALRSALRGYWENGQALLYPVGTAIVGEHHVDKQRVETTVMRKRADGFWDFITYDAEGNLSGSTRTPPRNLKTPVQCVGCHFGSRLFEPEKSFPAEAPPGPHGPRRIHVDERLRDAEVVAFFDEHRKRSDTVLGLYNTLFVAKLRSDRRAGLLAPADAQLLETLGL